jgi:ribosomal protein S18 acetylase RimI-like enzyme
MAVTTSFTLRPWTSADLPAMAALINERVVEEGDGELATEAAMANTYTHLENCDPTTDIIVVTDERGDVAGYSRVVWHDIKEGHRSYFVVFEGRSAVPGALRAAFEWGIDRAEQVAAGHDHPDRRVEVWATDGSAHAELIGTTATFAPYAWSAMMIRPHLRDIPDRPLPPGTELRAVERDHLRPIWEAANVAFRDGRFETEPSETDWEVFLDDAERSDTTLWQVAWAGPDVVGQVRTYVTDGEAERLGRRRAWTENISTHRDWRRRGMASALIASSLRQLVDRGFDEAALGVDLDNPTGALGVYEGSGYQVVKRYTSYFRPASSGRAG